MITNLTSADIEPHITKAVDVASGPRRIRNAAAQVVFRPTFHSASGIRAMSPAEDERSSSSLMSDLLGRHLSKDSASPM
jgi:hypothetical protein